MKEKLLALLIAKFMGVDSAILDRIATKQAASIADEGQLQTVADGITFATILQGEADRRATEASQTAVKNYEQKFGIKDGKPQTTQSTQTTQTTQTTTIPDDTPAWAKALIQQNQDLAKRLETVEVQKRAEQVSSIAKAKLKEKGIPESFVGSINLESEDKVDEFVAAQESRFAQFKQEEINAGRWTDKPAPGNPASTEKSVDDYVKIMEGPQAARVGVVDLGVTK